tara:strand:- start:175 stop:1110 length:936 start_codon:yes stop_codon:yes gene_type:complete
MSLDTNFNPKKTTNLFGLKDKFLFFNKLINNQNAPKVVMLSGKKGLGKFTLINHIIHNYFDKKNYDMKNNIINEKSLFHKNFTNNLIPNIYYLNGSNFKNVKIDDIRDLKIDLFKSQLSDDRRFVVLDDIESFNLNSLNALLKIIEEPTNSNFFFLINNESQPLLETIRSRSIEFTINIDDETRNYITDSLSEYFSQKILFIKNIIEVSPGNFIKFNHLIDKKNIDLNNKFLFNLNILIDSFKKEKDPIYRDLLIYFSEYYLKMSFNKNTYNLNKFIDNRSFLIKNINDFFLLNLNQKTLLSSLENRFINE